MAQDRLKKPPVSDSDYSNSIASETEQPGRTRRASEHSAPTSGHAIQRRASAPASGAAAVNARLAHEITTDPQIDLSHRGVAAAGFGMQLATPAHTGGDVQRTAAEAASASAGPAVQAKMDGAPAPVQMLRKPTEKERAPLDAMLKEMEGLLNEAKALIVQTRAREGRSDNDIRVAREALTKHLQYVNAVGNAAIQCAIKVFDLSHVNAKKISSQISATGPFLSIKSYDSGSAIGSSAYGNTNTEDGEIRIGPSAFRSSATLASTIGHEGIHAAKHSGKNQGKTASQHAWQEVEAHSWELKNAATLGLSKKEIEETEATIKRYRDQARGGSGGDCFLTTACVLARGLPDDCRELIILRRFRDHYMASQPDGPAMIGEYYRVAPGIVSAIEQRPDQRQIWDQVYDQITACIAAIDRGQHPVALARYRALVRDLMARY